MSEKNDDIPEGMQRYTMLGMDIVAPEGLPDEFVACIFESMIRHGAMVFDGDTGQIKPNPDMKPNQVGGLVMRVEDDMTVGEVRPLTEKEIIRDMEKDPALFEKVKKAMGKPKKP